MNINHRCSKWSDRVDDYRNYLRRKALYYVSRHLVSEKKLIDYLERKSLQYLKKYDSDLQDLPEEMTREISLQVAKYTQMGAAGGTVYAEARLRSLQQRGYGLHKIRADFNHQAVDEAIQAQVLKEYKPASSLVQHAKRKKIGLFADKTDSGMTQLQSQKMRQKAFRQLMNAGHDYDLVSQFLEMTCNEELEDFLLLHDGK